MSNVVLWKSRERLHRHSKSERERKTERKTERERGFKLVLESA